jgi:preprotein translocase subunit SecG
MGSSSGSFMTGRGTANLLTRTTAGLAAAFFVTSITLTLLAQGAHRPVSPLDLPSSSQPGPAGAPSGAPSTPAPKGGVLDSLEKGKQSMPLPPKSQ